MKKQILMITISLCSLTWAMEHKAKSANKSHQSDLIQPLFKPTPRQSMEREQEADILFKKLPGHTTSNTTSLHQTSLFTIQHDRAKL
jgi:hypothetical protein